MKEQAHTGLLLIDVQEKPAGCVERSCEVMEKVLQAILAFQEFHLPIIASEQGLQGWGETLPVVKEALGAGQQYFQKTAFSCVKDGGCKEALLSLPAATWVVAGFEAHVSVLQTTLDLLRCGKQVVVLNDAISSRSVFDYSTSIALMRDAGAKISSTEILLFDLLQDAASPHFKNIYQLVACDSSECCCSCFSS